VLQSGPILWAKAILPMLVVQNAATNNTILRFFMI